MLLSCWNERFFRSTAGARGLPDGTPICRNRPTYDSWCHGGPGHPCVKWTTTLRLRLRVCDHSVVRSSAGVKHEGGKRGKGVTAGSFVWAAGLATSKPEDHEFIRLRTVAIVWSCEEFPLVVLGGCRSCIMRVAGCSEMHGDMLPKGISAIVVAL